MSNLLGGGVNHLHDATLDDPGRSPLLGAYAAARPGLASEPSAEAEWYATLRSYPAIGGLELAFDETLHRAGTGHLASLLHPDWQSVVTCIPGTGRILATMPSYGLASTDEFGRARAIDDLEAVHAEVRRLQAALGDQAIRAIQIPSAPNSQRASSSTQSFAESLAEIASWEWGGASIMVEHCDSATLQHVAQKGYLGLDEEIAAVHAARSMVPATPHRTPIGHTINWARSAIESRDAATPEHHLERLRNDGALTALFFSGVSPVRTRFGEGWADAHLPARTEAGSGPSTADAPGPSTDAEWSSLLTPEAMWRALKHSGSLLYTGVKIGAGTLSPDSNARLGPTLATRDRLRTTLRALAFM